MKNKKIKILGITGIIALTFFQSSSFATTGIAQGTVRIRESASTSANIISVASDGEKVEILSEEDGWYKVKFEDVTGYMSKEYVKKEGESTSNEVPTNNSSNETTNNTNSATSNSAENTINNTASNSAENTINNTASNSVENTINNTASNSVENAINNVDSNSVENTVNNTDNTVDNTDNTTETQAVENSIIVGSQIKLESEISLRSVPSFSSRKTSNIANGTQVTVEDKLNNWVKITDNNVSGWVLSVKVSSNDNTVATPNQSTPPEDKQPDEVTPSQTQTPTSTPAPEETEPSTSDTATPSTSESPATTDNTSKKGVINVDSARIRKSPDGEVIDVADINDSVEILSEEGEWYKVNVDGHESGYIAKRLVTIKE